MNELKNTYTHLFSAYCVPGTRLNAGKNWDTPCPQEAYFIKKKDSIYVVEPARYSELGKFALSQEGSALRQEF